MVREICGSCLHDKDAHSPYNGNGQLVYCANCSKLCEMADFNTKPKPTSIEENMRIQLGREYSEYHSKELEH